MSKTQVVCLFVYIITMFLMASYGVKNINLQEDLRITKSIVWCYEHPNKKPVRNHLKKGWTDEFHQRLGGSSRNAKKHLSP
jgi:hypothetical protein